MGDRLALYFLIVAEYNRIAARVEHSWDAVIDNNRLATDEEILSVIQALQQYAG